MADARELQYSVGFDTGDAGDSIDDIISTVDELEQHFGAVEMGARNFGAGTVSACTTGREGLTDFAGALGAAAGAAGDASDGVMTASDVTKTFGIDASAAGADAGVFVIWAAALMMPRMKRRNFDEVSSERQKGPPIWAKRSGKQWRTA